VTTDERQAAQDRQMEAKAALAPERFRLVKASVATETPALTDEQCETLATQRLAESDRCELPAHFLLFFAHYAAAVRVDALGKQYDGWRLADPVEPTYRDGTDAVFHWRHGDWRVVSFAHGVKKVYRLVPQAPEPPPVHDDDPLLRAGSLAHRLPDHIRNHPDPRVRKHWQRIYAKANALKQRLIQDPYATVYPSHPQGASHDPK
jgi:hypothetical protein